ncbi:H-2 class I histocompatibility antigen, Q10 alpha chain-like [Acomys russatus]|uniref:H-2 class I histocompatibility antigen, Q10 alpha chain-like n=1 Tax=Acomys russatus TaxID=60746 RepID=UPI0021E2B009|nr:H-2 class I histocompatibility antigen, Q10 alpha chain-like [Acomys russatus]
MKTLVPEALLLPLLTNLALTRHPEGSHSLSTFVTLLTWPGILEPQFIRVCYVDGIQIERFNSRAETPRLEHCAPWVDQQTPEYWERNTNDLLILTPWFRIWLQKMLHIYNYSTTGSHTIQWRYGCDVLPGGYVSNRFSELNLNGQDYLALNEDMMTWTTVGKAAEMLRQEWEESGFARVVKTYMELTCLETLLTQLDYGMEILLRTVIPKVHVTHKARPDRKITLRCWALNFYPADITLTWQRHGSNQTQDMEIMDTRPAGDGTFQKWVSVVVASGEEQSYTCHVVHGGLPEPITLRWEPRRPNIPIMAVVTALVLGALLTGAVVTFLTWKKRSKGKERAGSELMSPWEYQPKLWCACTVRANFICIVAYSAFS